MCQFIETMLIEDDKICNLYYHNKRLNETLKQISDNNFSLRIEEFVYPQIENFKNQNNGIILNNYKARLLYSIKGIEDITLSPYSMRRVESLKCVYDNNIDYTFKSINRELLNQAFLKRGDCDDVLIVKNGLITDTTIANIALWNGTKWITPSKPLLKGTKRANLIDNGAIIEDDISVDELKKFNKIRLFNALINWGKIEIQNMNQLYV